METYSDVVGNRSYTFLRIAITKIRAEIPTITIEAHKEDRRNFVGFIHIINSFNIYSQNLHFTLKLADLNTFLDRFGTRIAGIKWRTLCIYEATPDIIGTLAEFFNGKHVGYVSSSTMKMDNSN